MNDLRAVGAIGYIRSVVSIIPSSPGKHSARVSKRHLPRDRIASENSLVYEMSVFIGQLYRRFVVQIRILAIAKVADTDARARR